MAKKAAKKPVIKDGRPNAKSRLTPEQWKAARDMWEANPGLSASDIAEEFGTTWRAVKERICDERWIRLIHKQLVLVPKPRDPWRPTKYREEFTEMLIRYFRSYDPKNPDLPVGDDGKPHCVPGFPTLEEFAVNIGVLRETLKDWADAKAPDGTLRYPAFSHAFKTAKAIQHYILVNGGLTGRYAAAPFIFASKNLIGWRDNNVDMPDDEADRLEYPDKAELESVYSKAMAEMREQKAALLARVRE